MSDLLPITFFATLEYASVCCGFGSAHDPSVVKTQRKPRMD